MARQSQGAKERLQATQAIVVEVEERAEAETHTILYSFYYIEGQNRRGVENHAGPLVLHNAFTVACHLL